MESKPATFILLVLICIFLILFTERSKNVYASEDNKLFLPIVFKSEPEGLFKFGISGTSNPKVIAAVQPISPSRIADPYIWNSVPNLNSSTQIIRACHGRNGQGYCWDKEGKRLTTNFHTSLEDWVKENKGQTWLIGNEPDNFDLNAGDGLSPVEYGNFYATVATIIKSSDTSSTVVFCQSTFPDIMDRTNEQFPFNSGPEYCEKAYETLKSSLPSKFIATDVIDAFATHSYISGAEESELNYRIAQWEEKLNSFTKWVNTLDSGKFDGIPLYLTEYGNLNNSCKENNSLRLNIDERGGEACKNNTPFYGRNSHEGYWGIQEETTKFFLSPKNQQWKAAWWFVSDCGANELDRGDLVISCNDSIELSRTGVTYKDTLLCQIEGVSCPEILVPTAITLNDKGVTKLPVLLILITLIFVIIVLLLLRRLWVTKWKAI